MSDATGKNARKLQICKKIASYAFDFSCPDPTVSCLSNDCFQRSRRFHRPGVSIYHVDFLKYISNVTFSQYMKINILF